MTVDPQGDVSREAIESLGGYVYQIYRSALAWLDLSASEFLYLEVAEDFAIATNDALEAVQVKETTNKVTINSDDIVATIDSFVTLMEKNPYLEVRMVHLTTSVITKEQSSSSRIGQIPLLESWRALSRGGDIAPLREILANSKLAEKTKKHIEALDDNRFRTEFLQRISFECGALKVDNVARLLLSKLTELITQRGGVYSQSEVCLNNLLIFLLKLSTQKENRKTDRARLEEFIEKATHIPVNKALHDQLLSYSIPATAPGTSVGISASKELVRINPVNKIPFPTAIANRKGQTEKIVSALSHFGISWIYGASGVGKTLRAKLATKNSRENWNILNLRGFFHDQAAQIITSVADQLSQSKTGGLILDDLDSPTNPHIRDAVLYLHYVCENYRLPLIITTFRPPCPEFCHLSGLSNKCAVHISEFEKADIEEILNRKGVHRTEDWANYIHLLSGGGHPQLAIAVIQSMEANQWNRDELKTLNSLLTGNQALDHVRANTRQRLYEELPEPDRRLLERLSLKLGGFDRKLVLSIAEVDPCIANAGYILERHIGAWIDQQADDLFSLSPLLSGLAEKNLTGTQKTMVHYAIAGLILVEKSLNPIDANSALFSACRGHNAQAIIKICLTIIQSDRNVLGMIAPHMFMVSAFRTDQIAYEKDTFVNAILRGAQLVLLAHSIERKSQFSEVLECFDREVELLSDDEKIFSIRLLAMFKAFTAESKFGALPRFWLQLSKLDELEERFFNLKSISRSIPQEKNLPISAVIFFIQVRQITSIEELEEVYDFLDSCTPEFREKLFIPLSLDEFETEMLFAGAWLNEHKANTIDPKVHEPIFSRLEALASKWLRNDIAVSARKHRAIIIDEYAEDKDRAIGLLNEGLALYGSQNYALIRAKAKVYYRSKDHKNSETLSRIIIESEAPLNVTEKVFLGREAGISAENQGDYAAARKYYLYGSKSASSCISEEMRSMELGLLADAAIASWHDGDRYSCIRDMFTVLSRLDELNSNTSLQAAHCQAISRHVTLWLMRESSGKKITIGNNEPPQIFPGVVSNPEPHPDIKEFTRGRPIEIAWYMLAAVENYCGLDLGITKGLKAALPLGPVIEGKILLTPAILSRAVNSLDVELFSYILKETIAELSYFKKVQEGSQLFNPMNPTYSDYPCPSEEDIGGFRNLAQGYALVFAAKCIFDSKSERLPTLIDRLRNSDKLYFGSEFLTCLSSKIETQDHHCSLATLIYQIYESFCCGTELRPSAPLLLIVKSLQIAKNVESIETLIRPAIIWLRQRWEHIWNFQRSQLSLPRLHEQAILGAFQETYTNKNDELKSLLLVTIPTLGFTNEIEAKNIIKSIFETKKT